MPAYYTSRIYVDLSDDVERAANFEKLVRWAFDKPLHVKPELGSIPAFLSESDNRIQLHTSVFSRRAVDALRSGKTHWRAALEEYLDAVVVGLNKFKVTRAANYEQKILESITSFKPYKGEVLDVVAVVSRYGHPESYDVLHKFFENMLPYTVAAQDVTSYSTWDFDVFRFIICNCPGRRLG